MRARERHDLTPLVIHDNYLINLASAHEAVRTQSIEAFGASWSGPSRSEPNTWSRIRGITKANPSSRACLNFIEGVAAAAQRLDSSAN